MSMRPLRHYPLGLVLSLGLLLAALPVGAELQVADEKLYRQSTEAAQKALSFYGEYENPPEERRLQEIGYRLVAQSDFERFPFSFYLVDMPVPNAFALPGGQVFVTRGMLDLGLDDDMLACLLGHEIAHVVYEHGQKMQRRATLLNILSQAALLGVMIGVDDDDRRPTYPYGGENRKGSLVQGAAATGVVFSELLMRKFSRGFEDEADVEGQRLAAGAGYDPDGARRLWQLMAERLPQSKQYGYWRTHPFSDTRLRAAEVRAEELKIQERRPADDVRVLTQGVLLAFRDGLDEEDAFTGESPEDRDPRDPRRPPDPLLEKKEPPMPWEVDLRIFLERTALAAWPRGPRAEELRWAHLERLKERELENDPVARDYGFLLGIYEKEAEIVHALDPDSSLLPRLEAEREELRKASREIYPKALEIWQNGVYQTPFLETFLSNWPRSRPAAEVALALAHAYSRVRRESEAVTHYLRAREAGARAAEAEGADEEADDAAREASEKALRGLQRLTPHLTELKALQRLAEESPDAELRRLASTRLDEMASSFEELENGSAYLDAYPGGEHAAAVEERLEKLAQNLYGEIVLYQGLGDHVKALERIQRILEHAPRTSAAEALREKAVIEA